MGDLVVESEQGPRELYRSKLNTREHKVFLLPPVLNLGTVEPHLGMLRLYA